MKQLKVICFICAFTLFFIACLPKPVTREKPDAYGCIPSSPSTFASVSVDISVAQSTIDKIVTGEVQIKSQPKVISLLSQSMVDQELRSYLRCLAIKQNQYTLEQAAYLESMSLFAATDPTPEQFQIWQNSNPFPKSNSSIINESDYGISQEMYNKLLVITGGQQKTIQALTSKLNEGGETELENIYNQFAELKTLYEELIRTSGLSSQRLENLKLAKEKLDSADLEGARDLLIPAAPSNLQMFFN